MKGTFFSADFIKHSDNSLRLLEFNTDTTIVDSQIDDINWTSFFNVLSSNNITEVAVVYKPYLHQSIVDNLSSSISTDATFINTFSKFEENIYSLYPLSPDDSSTKFILRLAYDEGAVFDSNYCKDNLQPLRLFTDADSGSYVTPFYCSSSADTFEINTLDNAFNGSNIPDAVIKPNSGNYRNPLRFYKVGAGSSEASFDYTMTKATSAAQPSTGRFRLNNYTAQNTATEIYLNETDDNSSSISSFFTTLDSLTSDIKGHIRISLKSDPSSYLEFSIGDFTDNGEWWTISNLTNLGSSGNAPFTNGDDIIITLVAGQSEDRWNDFIDDVKVDGEIIQQFNYHSSSLSNNKLSSYRSFNIVYGSNLDCVEVCSYKVNSSFEVPSSLSDEYNASSASNLLSDKHYFEYSTNFIKFGLNGLHEDHKIYKSDDSVVTLGNAAVGDIMKSYFISGSPQVEQDYIIKAWSHSGSTLPSGSYVTSSAVVFKDSAAIKHGSLVEVLIDDEPIYCGTGKQFLIYDSGSNTIRYELAGFLDADDHYLVDLDGNIKDIDSASLYLTPDNINIVELDLEDTDTYIISGSTDINGAVSHNAPCFVAGTQIETEDGIKNIEDIDAGDIVLTYNHATNETQYKEVRQVCMCSKEKTVVYTFDNNKTLEGTFDHPLYCSEKGYVSYKPNLTSEMYDLVVEQIEIGDKILTANNEEVRVIDMEESPVLKTVYNLKKVEDNHNFFANGILAHNRCFIAGTEITLGNKDVKNIENVIVGDEVLTYNESTKENEVGIVGELKQHEVDSVLKINFFYGNSITTTKEHPFYVSGKGWVKAGELIIEDVCKQTDGSSAPITSIERIEEKHLVYNLLNVSENHNFYANGILVHNK